MRTIERSSAFKRDYKRAQATPRHSKDVDLLLSTVIALLQSDQVLPGNNRDHALSGDWVGYRECVWRDWAHIASYSAEPQPPAEFEAVVSVDDPDPTPTMPEAWDTDDLDILLSWTKTLKPMELPPRRNPFSIPCGPSCCWNPASSGPEQPVAS